MNAFRFSDNFNDLTALKITELEKNNFSNMQLLKSIYDDSFDVANDFFCGGVEGFKSKSSAEEAKEGNEKDKEGNEKDKEEFDNNNDSDNDVEGFDNDSDDDGLIEGMKSKKKNKSKKIKEANTPK